MWWCLLLFLLSLCPSKEESQQRIIWTSEILLEVIMDNFIFYFEPAFLVWIQCREYPMLQFNFYTVMRVVDKDLRDLLVLTWAITFKQKNIYIGGNLISPPPPPPLLVCFHRWRKLKEGRNGVNILPRGLTNESYLIIHLSIYHTCFGKGSPTLLWALLPQLSVSLTWQPLAFVLLSLVWMECWHSVLNALNFGLRLAMKTCRSNQPNWGKLTFLNNEEMNAGLTETLP